jgi:serralysin
MAVAVEQDGTGNPEIDGVLSGRKWSGVLTYSFTDSAADYPGYYFNFPQTIQTISAAQQSAFTYAFGLLSGYTNLVTQYAGTDSADIRIAQTSSSTVSTALAFYPQASADDAGGDIWFGSRYAGSINDYRTPSPGNYAFLTLLHELGHAVGLKHAQERGGPSNVMVPTAHDWLGYTVMSYRAYPGGPITGYTNEQYGFPTTFMMNDIAALQTMYGANYTTNSGNTTYAWNPSTGQHTINGVLQQSPGGNRVFMTVWDGGGVDTYDFSAYTTNLDVDLNPGGVTRTSLVQLAYLGGGQSANGNVYNAYLFNNDTRSIIENAIGGSGNDIIAGNSANNTLDGGAGDDRILGGAGDDTLIGGSGRDSVDYSTASSSVTVNLSLTGPQNTSGAGADTLSGFEDLWGSQYADVLTGDSGNNVLVGLSGDDTLNGGGGNDTLRGGTGNDVVNGGDGIDYASYADASVGVTVSLAVTAAQNTGDGSDTLAAIEGLWGSRFDDLLTGDDANNNLIGEAGNDTLVGGLGNDNFEGGEGNDILRGGLGDDSLNGGSGADTADYADAGSGVTVSLAVAGLQNTLGAGSDTLTLIENLKGSSFNDTLTGDGAANTLDGGGGQDTLNGGLGDDRYIYRGGEVLIDAGGYDEVVTYVANFVLPEGFESLTLGSGFNYLTVNGTAVDNVLTGNEFANELFGFAGNDKLYGGVGDDRLEGGLGIDLLYGGTGNDALFGQDGIDRLEGEAGDDLMFAGEGDDVVIAGSGADRAWGENGADLMFGGEGDDILLGEFGADRLFGENGNDDLFGGYGNDQLLGEAGNDRLFGDVGDDEMFGGDGLDLILGEDGNDRAYGGNDADDMFGQAGDDLLLGENGNDRLWGGTGIDLLFGQAGNDLLQGEEDNDRLFGGTGADMLFGQAGDDELQGEEDNDRLFGGAGADRLFGQAGNDELEGEEDNDLLYGGAGADTLWGQAGDDALWGEQDNDRLNGGVGRDRLSGGGGNDFLDGGDQDDVLLGEAGADTLTGGGGADVFSFLTPSEGGDTITDFVSGVDRIQVLAGGFGGGLVSGSMVTLVSGAAPVVSGTGGQFLYNTSTGQLSWDADGTGGGAATLIATLSGAPALTAADIVVGASASPALEPELLVGLDNEQQPLPADTGAALEEAVALTHVFAQQIHPGLRTFGPEYATLSSEAELLPVSGHSQYAFLADDGHFVFQMAAIASAGDRVEASAMRELRPQPFDLDLMDDAPFDFSGMDPASQPDLAANGGRQPSDFGWLETVDGTMTETSAWHPALVRSLTTMLDDRTPDMFPDAAQLSMDGMAALGADALRIG